MNNLCHSSVAKRVFLKSLSPSFPYTDFTENTEKGRFLMDFSVTTPRSPCCPCPKKIFKKQTLRTGADPEIKSEARSRSPGKGSCGKLRPLN